MNWNALENISQLDTIDAESTGQKIMLFKHSTRCSISSASLNRVERNWQSGDAARLKPYYLDLIRHRDVSDAIAARYEVDHESPQVLVIENGKCIYHASHYDIRYDEIMEQA